MLKESKNEVVTIHCLRELIDGETRSFPMFVGFAPASDLVRIASAPSFDSKDPHRILAGRVLDPPVSDWQRPLDMERVADIGRVFDDLESLMPNPVLLSANVDVEALVPEPVIGKGGVPTGSYEVRVKVPEDGSATPLWILDGQHRINGLAQSNQRDRRIPVVLLLGSGLDATYTGRDFANIFAQVTVTAKALAPIHQEWLTYCYGLGDYADDADDSELHADAFETVAKLCYEPTLGSSESPNPWFNSIVFNPEPGAPGVKRSGFNYDCTELKGILLKHYFRPASALGGSLEADDVATELAKALTALEQVVPEPQSESVFFGKLPYGHKVMQDAFVSGVCSRLVTGEVPESWADLLKALKFHETNWNFSWATTRGGNAGNVSRKLASSVMSRALRTGTTGVDAGNLADYLRGNRAEVVVVCSGLKAGGGASTVGRTEITVVRGDDRSQNVGKNRHVKILQPGRKGPSKSTSDNVGKILVYDGSKPGKPTQIRALTGAGLDLADWGTNPLKLEIALEHYGDVTSHATLELSWTT